MFIEFLMATNNNSLPIPEFKGENYEYWSICMKHLIINKIDWDIMEDDYIEPADWIVVPSTNKATMREAQKKNSLVLFYLQEALDETIFPRIESCASTKVAWKYLKERYEGNIQVKQVRLQTLKMEFENLRIKDAKKFGDYCMKAKACVDKMRDFGEKVENEVIVKKSVEDNFPKWREISIIIEENKDLTTLSYDQLVGSLMSHEERFETPNVWGMEEKAFTSK